MKKRIGGACLNQTPIAWDENLTNIISAIDQAKKESVDILCLPELCITAYGCQDLFLHDWVLTHSKQLLLEVAKSTKGIAVAVGLPLKFNGKTYNTTCLLSNQNILGFYAKHFLANDGIHYEKRWFDSWPKNKIDEIIIDEQSFPIGDQIFEIDGIKIGFEICEDAWQNEHPDRPACRLYDQKVDLILNPSASHFAFHKIETREDIVVSSSKRFGCTYVYANQLGNESGRVIYDGDILAAHKGQLLFRNRRFSFESFNLRWFDLESSQMAEDIHYRGPIEEFAPAVALALFDYLRKSRAEGYVLSLSGGADSSSIAVLVAEMIRRSSIELSLKRVSRLLNHPNCKSEHELVSKILYTAYQGTENSSDETLQSAAELAKSIGATFDSWNIDDMVKVSRDTVEKNIGRSLTWEKDDIALQNIQARSRSPIIWMMANVRKSILLTTSNRSEGNVGYTTMDGDTSGSLAPIAGVDKPFILNWLKYAEKELGYQGLKYVNALQPSAELRPGTQIQTDEDDLMPYPIMRKIEELGIYQKQSPLAVYRQLSSELKIDKELLKSYIQKFYKLWSINQWKRERLAPSFHVDEFNVDPKTWCRFPILSGGFKAELDALSEL